MSFHNKVCNNLLREHPWASFVTSTLHAEVQFWTAKNNNNNNDDNNNNNNNNYNNNNYNNNNKCTLFECQCI